MLPKTKILAGLAGFTALLLFLTSGETLNVTIAIAQGGGENPPSTSIVKLFTELNSLIITLLNFLGILALKIIDWLLDPNVIFGFDHTGASTDEGTNILLKVWQYSRDIMNMIFAILLVIGAMVTVVTAKREIIAPYAMKFVLAVILVNFSWFFPRVILDVANVATASVYNLPSLMNSRCQWMDWQPDGVHADGTPRWQSVPTQCKAISKVEFFPNPDKPLSCPNGSNPLLMESILAICMENLDDPSTGRITNTGFGILNGLVVNHGHLLRINQVAGCPPGGCGEVDKISEAIRFVIMTSIVVFVHMLLVFPLIGMMVAFFIRIPILWLTIAFMPFMFLGYVIEGKFIKFNTMDIIWKKFLAVAFLPTAVAVPITLGYIMLNAASGWAAPTTAPKDVFPLISGVPSLWALVWLLTAAAVTWIGTFSALKIDEHIGKLIAPIESMGKQWAKLPLIVPLPMGYSGKGADRKVKWGRSIGEGLMLARNPQAIFDPLKDTQKLGGGGTTPPPQVGSQPVDQGRVTQAVQEQTEKLRDVIEKVAAGTMGVKAAVEQMKAAPGDRGLNANEFLAAAQQMKDLKRLINDSALQQFTDRIRTASPSDITK
jgi:hypothetical protein